MILLKCIAKILLFPMMLLLKLLGKSAPVALSNGACGRKEIAANTKRKKSVITTTMRKANFSL